MRDSGDAVPVTTGFSGPRPGFLQGSRAWYWRGLNEGRPALVDEFTLGFVGDDGLEGEASVTFERVNGRGVNVCVRAWDGDIALLLALPGALEHLAGAQGRLTPESFRQWLDAKGYHDLTEETSAEADEREALRASARAKLTEAEASACGL